MVHAISLNGFNLVTTICIQQTFSTGLKLMQHNKYRNVRSIWSTFGAIHVRLCCFWCWIGNILRFFNSFIYVFRYNIYQIIMNFTILLLFHNYFLYYYNNIVQFRIKSNMKIKFNCNNIKRIWNNSYVPLALDAYVLLLSTTDWAVFWVASTVLWIVLATESIK